MLCYSSGDFDDFVQDLLERLQQNNELLDDERQELAKYTEVSFLSV